MATRTERTSVPSVTLTPNEFLEYRLKVRGSSADFSWSDDNETILKSDDFKGPDGLPTSDVLIWALRAAAAGPGQVNLTVPQAPAYQRPVTSGGLPSYTISLAFIHAVGYTLTVTHFKESGAQIELCTDVDYAMEQVTDTLNEGLTVVIP